MQLNVQVVPFNVSLEWPSWPSWAKLVQLPAREEQGEVQECSLCGGTGKYGRHEEQCRKCGGTGKAKFITALRAEPQTEEQVNELSALLDNILRNDCVCVQRTIRLTESGGGLTNTGRATIVCGLHGEALVGFGGHAQCGAAHATFYVHAAMVIQYGQHRRQGSGIITFVGIDRNARHHLGIERVPLWQFTDGEEEVEILSPKRVEAFEFPAAAVDAARRKARDYHCRSAYYAASGGSSGPSGALKGAGAAFGGMPSPLKGPGIGY